VVRFVPNRTDLLLTWPQKPYTNHRESSIGITSRARCRQRYRYAVGSGWPILTLLSLGFGHEYHESARI